MSLREEQLRARIVHYKAEMETSPELDAITAQVVAQLQQLQARATYDRPAASAHAIAADQSRELSNLLGRIFRSEMPSVLVEQSLRQVARKLTRMFFESESTERSAEGGGQFKTIHHSEQSLFYVLRRYENRMQADLEGFSYSDPEIRERTLDLLQQIINDQRVSFLSRRSPELKRLLAVFNNVLLNFFQNELPPQLRIFAAEIIEDCGAARTAQAVGYKIIQTSFAPFRVSFERRFISKLIGYVRDRVVYELDNSEETFREETLMFVRAPKIYSHICSLFCDAVYDFLCIEGFLDLPVDWRAKSKANP